MSGIRVFVFALVVILLGGLGADGGNSHPSAKTSETVVAFSPFVADMPRRIVLPEPQEIKKKRR